MSAILTTWQERFSRLDRVLLVVSVVAALLFLALRPYAPFAGDVFLKALPIAYLALLAWKHVRGAHGNMLALGLFFSACGDVVLELNHRAWFAYGLGLFLVAHICYILLFKRDFEFTADWLPVAGLVALYGTCVAVFLIPRLGSLLLPVLAYMFVISGMGVFAAFRAGSKLPVFLGAITFMGSDTMIALNKFLPADPYTGFLIMPSYYAAQFLIAGSYIVDPDFQSDLTEDLPTRSAD